MNKDKTTRLLDYLEGNLSKADHQLLERELADSPSLTNELNVLRELLDGLQPGEPEQPSPELRSRFYDFLSEQSKDQAGGEEPKKKRPWFFQLDRLEWGIAATIALVLIGVGFGALWQRNLQQQQQIASLVTEVAQTRKIMVLNMLDQNSASERIKALNVVQRENPGPDPQIMAALINTLNSDDNVNVRVKAAEALLRFSDHPQVVDALIESLGKQPYPEVQITLIDVLVEIKARGAVNEFQHMLEKEEVLDVVRSKAASGIDQLL